VHGLFGGQPADPRAETLAHELKKLVGQIRARTPGDRPAAPTAG